MKKVFTPTFLTVTALIALAAVARIFAPIPNFTPIAAIALFGGAYFSKKGAAFLVPLAALAVTDLWIGGYHAGLMLTVYGCFALTGCIGLWLSRKISFVRVAMGAVASSVVFFIITNLVVWMTFPGYPMTFGGLMLCYEMAIPFFRNEILGTLLYSGVLFGTFELAKRRFPVLA